MKRALIVVDPQNDFMPGGSLSVKDGDQIVPVINKLTKSSMYDLVIFTKDWHPADMEAFASQHKGKNVFDTYMNNNGEVDVLWPDHCVAGTEGAEFHKDIDRDSHALPARGALSDDTLTPATGRGTISGKPKSGKPRPNF